jgi:hypothetical protein
MPCPCQRAGLWHADMLSWTYDKKYIKKKLYEERLLQFTMFSRKNYQNNLKKNISKTKEKKSYRKTL